MKKVFAVLLCFVSLLSCFSVAYAQENDRQVEYLSDGSYFEVVTEESGISPLSSTVTKSRTATYYSAGHEAQWYVKVTGKFTYGDGYAKCTSSSVSAGVYEPDEMVLVCPGESGRTKGPVIAARKAQELGMHVVCTTLEPQGVLAQASDVVIFKPSGRELGLPSTKGHSTGIFLLLLCFIEAAHATGKISDEEYAKYMSGMEHLPAAVIEVGEGVEFKLPLPALPESAGR